MKFRPVYEISAKLAILIEMLSSSHVITSEGPQFQANNGEMRTLAIDHVTKNFSVLMSFPLKVSFRPGPSQILLRFFGHVITREGPLF